MTEVGDALRGALEFAAEQTIAAGHPVLPAMAYCRGGEHLVTLFMPPWRDDEDKYNNWRHASFVGALLAADEAVWIMDAFIGHHAEVQPRDDPEAFEALVTHTVLRGQPVTIHAKPYRRADDGTVSFEEPSSADNLRGAVVEMMEAAVKPFPQADDQTALGYMRGLLEDGWMVQTQLL